MPAPHLRTLGLSCAVAIWTFTLLVCGSLSELQAETRSRSGADAPSSAALLRITATENGSHVPLRSGEALELTLDENPSTGFRWQIVTIDSDILELETTTFNPPQTQRVGAGGQAVWRFRAVRAGSARLILSLYRPWEGLDSDVDRFEIRVDVASAP